MRKLFVFAVLLMLLLPLAHARSVTMNFALNIAGKTNTIHVNGTDYDASQAAKAIFTSPGSKYVSAENNNRLLALVSAGENLSGIELNTSYSSQDYLLSVNQDDNNNRLLVAYTRGTWRDVDSKAESVGFEGFLAKTFGDFVRTSARFFYFIRLEYRNIDLSSAIDFSGPIKLLVRNAGQKNITMEVLR